MAGDTMDLEPTQETFLLGDLLDKGRNFNWRLGEIEQTCSVWFVLVWLWGHRVSGHICLIICAILRLITKKHENAVESTVLINWGKYYYYCCWLLSLVFSSLPINGTENGQNRILCGSRTWRFKRSLLSSSFFCCFVGTVTGNKL